MPFFAISFRVNPMTSKTASLISNLSVRGGAFLTRARIRSTTSLAWTPLFTMKSRAPDFLQGWRLSGKPMRSGIGVAEHRSERLADFVGNRSRQLPHRCDAVRVRELHLYLSVCPFGSLPIG